MVNPTNIGNVQSILSQIRQYQTDIAEAGNLDANLINRLSSDQKVGFTDSVKAALQEVNATQQTAAQMKTDYERGADIPLTDVVMSIQKSSLAFEATLQIRNKVLKAYEEIINMPV